MSEPIPSWPLVKRGNRYHPVPTLQHLLRSRGHTVAVDGIFGPTMEFAVRSFQADEHLIVDGLVGVETWAAIIRVIRRGSTGGAVCGVQEELTYRNLTGDPGRSLPVDGAFGAHTEAAVRSFQEAVGITVDGIVGAVTWRALVSGVLSL